eukprot:CAMPEP_0194266834 /NCGR_PEP_ID=MMETSP0169-20130528/1601_1 /TAXON_ID=218684 /ORGANISM="Corethron pennatum, Strain L29A3" /LENGTH=630 /DNA_ID=CAMNT_0039007605 /DNA_START=144 /DNA_END=2037 /DNA_ORIENTATION=+
MRSHLLPLSLTISFDFIPVAAATVNSIPRSDTTMLRIRDAGIFDNKTARSHTIPSEVSEKNLEFESFFDRSMKLSYGWGSPNNAFSCPDYDPSLEYNKYVLNYKYTVQTTTMNDSAEWINGLENTFRDELFKILSECSEGTESDHEIQAVDASPKDVVLSDKSCSITEPGAKSCTVMQGQITIISKDKSDDVKSDALQAIFDGIDDNTFLSTKSREIIKIDIYEEETFVSFPNYDITDDEYVLKYDYSVQTSIEDDSAEWISSLEKEIFVYLSEKLQNSEIDYSSLGSLPLDIKSDDESCPADESGAKSCTVIKGELTFTSLSDITDNKIEHVRATITGGMEEYIFVNDRNPEIIKVEMNSNDSLETFVSCPNYDPDVEDHVVQFIYSVQTTIENDPGDWIDSLENVMLKFLSKSLLDCSSPEFSITNGSRRSLSVEGCTSASSAPKDNILQDKFCINTEPGSKSCTVVQGQLTITLADVTDVKKNAALNIIIEGMTNDDYIGQDYPELIKVEIYYESAASSLVNNYPEEDEDDSNLLAWFLVPLALTFIILFFFITRKYRSRSNDDNLKDDLDFNMDITDDNTTDMDNDSPTAHVLGDEDSWVNDVEGYQDVDRHEVPDFTVWVKTTLH